MEISIDEDYGDVDYGFVNGVEYLWVFRDGRIFNNGASYSTSYVRPRFLDGSPSIYEIDFDSDEVICAPPFLLATGSDAEARIEHTGLRLL